MALVARSVAGHSVLRLAGLAMAGALSFLSASYFSGWKFFDSSGDEDIVLPTKPSSAKELREVSERSAVQVRGLAPEMDSRVISAPLRMNPATSRNPFGPLNLAAEAELEAGMSDMSASSEQTVRRLPESRPVRPRQQPTLAAVNEVPLAVAAQPTPIVPAAPATAPPLPFMSIGAIQGPEVAKGRPVAFLRYQDEIVVVRQGDGIWGSYLVEEITPERIQFLYLPLNQRQTLVLIP